MKLSIRVTFACAVFLLLAGAVVAQKLSQQSPPKNVIHVGQPLAEVELLLRAHTIELREGNWQLSSTDTDSGTLAFTVDEPAVTMAIFYSKSQRVTAGLALVVTPSVPRSRRDTTFLSANSISLGSDGSYSVHFKPPVKPDPNAPSRRSVYPSSQR